MILGQLRIGARQAKNAALVAVYSLHNRMIACQCVTIIMQSCICHSLAASRPCCQFRIYSIQFQCNMSCQRLRKFISCCFIWLYLTGKYISETFMPSVFGTFPQGRVCDPGKDVIIAYYCSYSNGNW